MTTVVIIVIVVLVLLVAALLWAGVQRKQRDVARERAGELREEASAHGHAQEREETQVRATQIEADRARAEADALEAQAREARTSYDQSAAQREDAIREADRIDPDVDHEGPGYTPTTEGATDPERPAH